MLYFSYVVLGLINIIAGLIWTETVILVGKKISRRSSLYYEKFNLLGLPNWIGHVVFPLEDLVIFQYAYMAGILMLVTGCTVLLESLILTLLYKSFYR